MLTRHDPNERREADSWVHATVLYAQCMLAYAGQIAVYSGLWLIVDNFGGYGDCGWLGTAPEGAALTCTTRSWVFVVVGGLGC